MNILQAIYQFQTGGGALQVVADLATAARSAGHRVTVLSKDVPISEAIAAERFFSGNKLLDWWRLRQRLQQERYDVIHVHDRYCSLLVRMMPGAPPSVQTNHIAYRTRRSLTRFADCVVGCSQAMDRHHAEFFKLPASRRALIPNGVRFCAADAEAAQRLRDQLPHSLQNRQICLTVARLSAQKGHTYLLEAIASLPEALRQRWGFVWAGNGDLMEALQQQAETLGIAADVLFLGQTSTVPEWLALADAFVLPSLYEGLPLALMEAMSVGLPCLATAIDGNTELLRHRENGLLCAAADAPALAQELETLLKDADLREHLGQHAQADYWQHWTFDRTWQQYEALYQRLCAASATSGDDSTKSPLGQETLSSRLPVSSLTDSAMTSPKSSPKFSVVIPAYNASPYIADSVTSVLSQTESDFEVIAVDDGSTDDTAEKLAAFTDPRLRVIRRENGGLAAARNTGIAAATGEFVAFLDADDRWCPEKLAAHRRALDYNPEAAVSYDWAAFINEVGDRTGLYMSQSRIALTPEALLLKNYLGNGSTSVVRRSLLKQVGGFDEHLKRMVDQELWVRLTHSGHKFQLVPQVLTEYRTHPNSFTADTSRMLQGLEVFLERIAHYAPDMVKRLAPLAIAFNHRWMARAAFVAGDYDKAKHHAYHSLRASPQVLWRDPRAPITFAAIALQAITPQPLFSHLLHVGQHVITYWFRLRHPTLLKIKGELE